MTGFVGEFLDSSLAPAAGVALAAYLARRRWTDALVLGLGVLAADLVEIGFAPRLLALCTLLVLVLTRRPRFSLVVGAAAMGVLVAGVRLKMQFAGTPLTWQDVRFFVARFGDNVAVFASQPTLLMHVAAVLAGAGGLCWLVWRWDGRPAGEQSLRRGAIVACTLGLALWNGQVIRAEALAMNATGAWHLGQSYELNPLQHFFATMASEPKWGVPDADTTAFRTRVASVPGAAQAVPADIVVVLQESQFNPATIEGCPPPLCDRAEFRARSHTVALGPLQVHVFGGGTWLTEFAFAAGVPHDVFGVAGGFAPFNVAPGIQRSFVRSLRNAGYRTVAVYPVGGEMMNARAAYAAYGFDRFYDAADVGLRSRFDNTDADMHAAARRVLAAERRSGQPVFLLLVTIFNHGEHGVWMDRVPAALAREAAAAFPQEHEARNVADYLWRTGQFEEAVAQTRASVLDAGRPAVFAWFGDHQPPFGNAQGLSSRIRSMATPGGSVPARFQTWYAVSSNRAPEVASVPPAALDIVFLPGVLAQAAGARVDDWLAANIAAREACGGLLEACRDPATRGAYLTYLWKDLHAIRMP